MPHAIGVMTVTGIAIPHDAAGPLAFVTTAGGCSLGHATDFGHVGAGFVAGFRDCDAVLIESNYDPGMLREGRTRGRSRRGSSAATATCRTATWPPTSAATSARPAGRSSSPTSRRPTTIPSSRGWRAEAALRKRGRTEVRLEVTGEEGTEWMALVPPPPALRRPQQLRLF